MLLRFCVLESIKDYLIKSFRQKFKCPGKNTFVKNDPVFYDPTIDQSQLYRSLSVDPFSLHVRHTMNASTSNRTSYLRYTAVYLNITEE